MAKVFSTDFRRLICAVSTAVCVALTAPAALRAQTAPSADAEPPAQCNAETKPAPPTPIAIEKQELGDPRPWSPDWDTMIEQALPADLLSTDRERQVSALCPRFKFLTDTDRRAFWAYFFQALAGAEAGLEPTANVRHKDPAVAVIDPVTHRVARQEGLLQLAYMDSDRYNCDFDWDKDKELPEHDPAKSILQPKNNLLCGIHILEYQLATQHKPVLSGSSYWVTLRPGTYSHQQFLKQMANEPDECGAPRTHRRWLWRRRAAAGASANQTYSPAAEGEPAAASSAPAGAKTAEGRKAEADGSATAAH